MSFVVSDGLSKNEQGLVESTFSHELGLKMRRLHLSEVDRLLGLMERMRIGRSSTRLVPVRVHLAITRPMRVMIGMGL